MSASPRVRSLNGITQTWVIARMQLTNVRWAWRSMLVVGVLTPALWLIAVRFLRAGEDDPSSLQYLVAGNAVLALMFEVNNRTSGNLAFLKETGGLEFLRSLPTSRFAVVFGTIVAFSLLALPGASVAIVLGNALLGTGVNLNVPLLLVTVVVSAFGLAGLGATIGILSRTNEGASSLSLATTLLLLFLGPVMVASDRIPYPLVCLGFANPSVHAAFLFRQALFGTDDLTGVAVSLVFLTLFAVVTNVISQVALDRSVGGK